MKPIEQAQSKRNHKLQPNIKGITLIKFMLILIIIGIIGTIAVHFIRHYTIH